MNTMMLPSMQGMFKIATVTISNISVNIDHNDYWYTNPVSFADKIPANAIVLAATVSNWGLANCGSFSVYTDTSDKSIQIMAPKSGNVGALFIDVLYI